MRTAAGGALLFLLLEGCALVPGTGDDVDPDEATKDLHAQRDTVVDAAAGLVASLDGSLGLEPSVASADATARWDGCESTVTEEFRDFRYASTLRLVLVPGAPEEVAGPVEDAVAEAGWTVEERGRREPGHPARVVATRGEVTARITDVPGTTDASAGDLVVQLTGDPCVEVPEDERHEWTVRQTRPPQLP